MTTVTDRMIFRLNNTMPDIPNLDTVKNIWWFINGMWAPQGFSAQGNSYITLTNDNEIPPETSANLFIIHVDTSGQPLFVLDQGLIVQKDISAGGFVSSNQGEFWIGSSRHDQVDVPKIILAHASVSRLGGKGLLGVPPVPSGTQFPVGIKKGTVFIRTDTNTLYKYNGSSWDSMGSTSKYAGNFDTLYLRKRLPDPNPAIGANVDTPGNLDLGDISIHGHLGVGDTVTTSLNPNPGLGLGNPTNRWQGIVVETAYVNAISPIPSPYGNGTYINVSGILRSTVNDIGYRSYYGGGGGGSNGGICLDQYGNMCFVNGNSSNYWSVLPATGGGYSPIFAVGQSNWVSVLSLSGSGTRTVYAGSNGVLTNSSSSERYKENIEELKDSSWIYKLKTVSFEWKDPERKKTDKTQIGLIAENVHMLCPELAWTDDQGRPEGIHYEKLAVPLLAEMKKLKGEIDHLKDNIVSLKAHINKLETKTAG